MTDASLGRSMWAEIEEQGRLLEERSDELFESCRALGPPPGLVVFAARGSSDKAALYGRYLVETRLGVPVSLAAPSVLTRYHAQLRYRDALVVGVSQSAMAPDVAAVLRHAGEAGQRTLSMTNETSGPVVDVAERNVFLGAGPEHAVAATKTFTLTLLAMYQLVRALGAQLEAPKLGSAVQAALSSEAPDRIARALGKESGLIFTLGRGFQYAVAEEAALKLMECALIPAKAFSLADFAHGPMALAEPGTSAIVFGDDEGDDTSRAVRAQLKASGARVFELAGHPSLSEELRPIGTAILAQRLALALARQRGLNPDEPRNLSKVTKTL